jgi:hypothetical protein
MAVLTASVVSMIIGYSIGQAQTRSPPINQKFSGFPKAIFSASSAGYQPVPEVEASGRHSIDL